MDDQLLEYHESYSLNEFGQKISNTQVYKIDNKGYKSLVDTYEELVIDDTEIIETLTNESYSVKAAATCSACVKIAVKAYRVASNGFKYLLKKTPTSTVVKTITSNSLTKVAPIVSKYTPHKVNLGIRVFTLRKQDLQHMLTRHHMSYWNSGIGAPLNQTFFINNMSPKTLNHIASQAIGKNAATLNNAIKNGKKFYSVSYTYSGITYKVGVDFTQKAITQIYPTSTFLLP